jgi:hypothetical protein
MDKEGSRCGGENRRERINKKCEGKRGNKIK